MTQQAINVGSIANDGTGDPLRAAGQKINANFSELYGGLLVANRQTASYTLVAADAGRVVEMASATATTLTIPPNGAVPFAVGTTLSVYRYGAGAVSIAAGTGVTIRTAISQTLRAQYSSATLRKIGTDEWDLAGDLT